jgi:hypothetical protein
MDLLLSSNSVNSGRFIGKARNNRRMVFSVVRAVTISGQQLSKHIPAATDTNAAIEEQCFLCGPCQDVISKGQS